MNDMERLKDKVEQRIDRMHKAERERGDVFSFTAYLGTVGLLMVLPVVAGAYLGTWLDEWMGSYVWAFLLILAGVAVGALNVYLFVNRR